MKNCFYRTTEEIGEPTEEGIKWKTIQTRLFKMTKAEIEFMEKEAIKNQELAQKDTKTFPHIIAKSLNK